MQRIKWIAGATMLLLALGSPASARGSSGELNEDYVKGVGVVIESSRKSLTLVGGIQLEISHRTRFFTEDGEEIPRSEAIRIDEESRGSGRGRSRATTSVGRSVVEYEGHQNGKRIQALVIKPRFKREQH